MAAVPKRKLLGGEKLKADYLTFMQKNLDPAHASRVPTSRLHMQPGKVWYLPHFNVYHPRKPDQIQVVFDCSAVFEIEITEQAPSARAGQTELPHRGTNSLRPWTLEQYPAPS